MDTIDWPELVRRLIKKFGGSWRVSEALREGGCPTHESTIRSMTLRGRHGSQFDRAVSLYKLAEEEQIEIPFRPKDRRDEDDVPPGVGGPVEGGEG